MNRLGFGLINDYWTCVLNRLSLCLTYKLWTFVMNRLGLGLINKLWTCVMNRPGLVWREGQATHNRSITLNFCKKNDALDNVPDVESCSV